MICYGGSIGGVRDGAGWLFRVIVQSYIREYEDMGKGIPTVTHALTTTAFAAVEIEKERRGDGDK